MFREKNKCMADLSNTGKSKSIITKGTRSEKLKSQLSFKVIEANINCYTAHMRVKRTQLWSFKVQNLSHFIFFLPTCKVDVTRKCFV